MIRHLFALKMSGFQNVGWLLFVSITFEIVSLWPWKVSRFSTTSKWSYWMLQARLYINCVLKNSGFTGFQNVHNILWSSLEKCFVFRKRSNLTQRFVYYLLFFRLLTSREQNCFSMKLSLSWSKTEHEIFLKDLKRAF